MKHWEYLFIGLLSAVPGVRPVIAQTAMDSVSKFVEPGHKRIQIPSFPDRSVDIIAHGAFGDGQTLNTKAFADAIEACSQAGGGRVVVPAGIWLTGPIVLKSKINLHLENGAVILFSKRLADYPILPQPTPTSKNYSYPPMISGFNLMNVAITGDGIVDGNGDVWRPRKKEKYSPHEWEEIVSYGGVMNRAGSVWWPSKESLHGEEYLMALKKKKLPVTAGNVEVMREYLRPNLIELFGCKNVLFDGPSFQNSPKYVLYPTQCENVTIQNTAVRNPWNAQNGDGIDINACHDVLISHCTVDVGDDGICLKLGKPDPERGWSVACENIRIENCTVFRAHGGFVIGSSTDGGARNVAVQNCIFSGTDVGLRLKSGRNHTGIVEDIHIDGIRMKDIRGEAIVFDLYYENIPAAGDRVADTSAKVLEQKGELPFFRNFTIENITCVGAQYAIHINDLPECCVRNIAFNHLIIEAERGLQCTNSEAMSFRDLHLVVHSGPAFVFQDASNISLDDVTASGYGKIFLQVNGSRSKAIHLKNIHA
ncbi:MAG: glycoside hydrolase family 28 protein, partial [Bacteroidota bacterium]